jgi:hypothetical protein
MGLRHLHRAGTLMLSAVMVVIGIALVVEALTGLGGISVRLLAGVLFVAGGFGRLYVELRRDGVPVGAKADDPARPSVGRGQGLGDEPVGNGASGPRSRRVKAPATARRRRPRR